MLNTKIALQKIQKLIPKIWLNQLQYIHSSLIWQWILRWGSKPIIFNQKSAMIFSPHQDDETFGCGGLIALKRERQIPVIVVIITDGGGSDLVSENTIVAIRKQETVAALNILGVKSSEIYFLDQPDGKLQDLTLEEKQQTITQINQLIKYYQPEEIYVPHYKDCHQDHEASYRLVKAAITEIGNSIDLFQYPIWLFWRSPIFILLRLQDIVNAYHLSISTVQDKKHQAIAAYHSQINTLPPKFIKQFLSSEEIFFKVEL